MPEQVEVVVRIRPLVEAVQVETAKYEASLEALARAAAQDVVADLNLADHARTVAEAEVRSMIERGVRGVLIESGTRRRILEAAREGLLRVLDDMIAADSAPTVRPAPLPEPLADPDVPEPRQGTDGAGLGEGGGDQESGADKAQSGSAMGLVAFPGGGR